MNYCLAAAAVHTRLKNRYEMLLRTEQETSRLRSEGNVKFSGFELFSRVQILKKNDLTD